MDWLQFWMIAVAAAAVVFVTAIIAYNVSSYDSIWKPLGIIFGVASFAVAFVSLIGILVVSDNRTIAKDAARGCIMVHSKEIAVSYKNNLYYLDEGQVQICERK